MKQVFRLMGSPDRVIAFDELPADLLNGLEMFDSSKLGRDWREFIGIRERVTKIPPDRDPLTGQVRYYEPIIDKAPYAYIVDRELNNDMERWQEIESYVRRAAPREFRLLDKLADMAKPLARDEKSEVSLDPVDVVIIPLPRQEVPKPPLAQAPPVVVAQVEALKVAEAPAGPLKITPAATGSSNLECPACQKIFSSKQALRMHVMKKHSEAKVAA